MEGALNATPASAEVFTFTPPPQTPVTSYSHDIFLNIWI